MTNGKARSNYHIAISNIRVRSFILSGAPFFRGRRHGPVLQSIQSSCRVGSAVTARQTSNLSLELAATKDTARHEWQSSRMRLLALVSCLLNANFLDREFTEGQIASLV
jgi:hypothetical protein